MTVTLYLGDCLDVMADIPTGSVDAVVTDPPYKTNAEWQGGHVTASPSMARRTGHDWQTTYEWLVEAARILKRGGQWYAFTNREDISYLLEAAGRCGLVTIRMLVWIKSNPRPSIPRRIFRNTAEMVMWGTTGGAPNYFGAVDQKDALAVDTLPICGGHERTEHPTQKPLRLIERYVRIGCPPDGTVLDPFMGSGTTGVACVQTGRNFIGIEIDPTYFAIAEKRIKEAQMQPTLDGLL